jgi:hypothetical protein
MSAAISRARRMLDDRDPDAERAVELAELFCRNSRRKVKRLFRELWGNEDVRKNQVAATVMSGAHAWLEQGRLDLGLTPEDFKTRSLTQGRPQEATERRAAAGS